MLCIENEYDIMIIIAIPLSFCCCCWFEFLLVFKSSSLLYKKKEVYTHLYAVLSNSVLIYRVLC